MTAQEAIDALKLNGGLQIEGNALRVAKFFEGLDVAIEALEKQIPKRPNKAIDSSWGTAKEVDECPACGYFLTETHFINPDDKEKITFCEVCGQKIDWSESNA